MQSRLAAAGLATIADKLESGERLDFADGPRTYYNQNIRLEATNVCVASCLFCSFARLQPGDPGAYTMSLDEAWDKLRRRAHQPLTEIHVVNGLHPDLPWDYYLELL